ncbi:MAG: RloB family protein [Bacteroidales bacterium]|nr:RloB family protein [Bacteroidales bacterium]
MTRKPKIDNALLKRLARTEQKRQEGTRSKRVRFLIVSEGIKTEPNYFIALRDNLPLGTLSIIEVQGLGKETIRIIDEAIAIRDRCQKKYDRIWAVFDRDSFPAKNFNAAINKAERNDIKCAWSNEAFELWFLLHFQFVNHSMGRSDYKAYLQREVRKVIKGYKYKKNSTETYKLLQNVGNQGQAIKWARQLELNFIDHKYDKHNPCTKVHLLIEEINNPEKILEEIELIENAE